MPSSGYAVSVDGALYAIRYSPLGLPSENAVFLPDVRTEIDGTLLHRWDAAAAAYAPLPMWPEQLWWLRLLAAAHVRTKGTRSETVGNFRATARILCAWLRRTSARERIAFFANPTKAQILKPLDRTREGAALIPNTLRLLDWARREAPELLSSCVGGGGAEDPVALSYGREGAAAGLRAILAAPQLTPFATTYHDVRELLLRRCGARLDELLLRATPSSGSAVVPFVPLDLRVRLPECVDRVGFRLYPHPLDCSLLIRADRPVDDEERFYLMATPREAPWRAFLSCVYALCSGEGATVVCLDARVAARRALYAPLRSATFPFRGGVLWLAPDRPTARNLAEELGAADVALVTAFAAAAALPLCAIIVEGVHVLPSQTVVQLLATLRSHAAAAAAAGGPPLAVVLAGDSRSPHAVPETPWLALAAAVAHGSADQADAATADGLATLLARTDRGSGIARCRAPPATTVLHGLYRADRSTTFISNLGECRFPSDAVFLVTNPADLRRAARVLSPGPALPGGSLLSDGAPACEGDRVRCVAASPILERKGLTFDAVYRIGRCASDRAGAPRVAIRPDFPDDAPEVCTVTPGQLASAFETARFLLLDHAANVHFGRRPVVVLMVASADESSHRRKNLRYLLAGVGAHVTIVSNDRAWAAAPPPPDSAIVGGETDDHVPPSLTVVAPPLWREMLAPLTNAMEKE